MIEDDPYLRKRLEQIRNHVGVDGSRIEPDDKMATEMNLMT